MQPLGQTKRWTAVFGFHVKGAYDHTYFLQVARIQRSPSLTLLIRVLTYLMQQPGMVTKLLQRHDADKVRGGLAGGSQAATEHTGT